MKSFPPVRSDRTPQNGLPRQVSLAYEQCGDPAWRVAWGGTKRIAVCAQRGGRTLFLLALRKIFPHNRKSATTSVTSISVTFVLLWLLLLLSGALMPDNSSCDFTSPLLEGYTPMNGNEKVNIVCSASSCERLTPMTPSSLNYMALQAGQKPSLGCSWLLGWVLLLSGTLQLD